MERRRNYVWFVLTTILCTILASSVVSGANVPQDRVIAMYFHRTQRCPTCLKMGGYSEEAVKTAFATQVKTRQVEFHYVDFQAAANAKLVKAYGVKGPSLIVAKITDNKVVSYKNLQEIWSKVGDKPVFLQYVQANVKDAMAE